MKLSGPITYLFQALHWLQRSLFWRKFNRSAITGIPVEHIAQMQAGWAKQDLEVWRIATFEVAVRYAATTRDTLP